MYTGLRNTSASVLKIEDFEKASNEQATTLNALKKDRGFKAQVKRPAWNEW